jgi:uncharacterized OB-fold protein
MVALVERVLETAPIGRTRALADTSAEEDRLVAEARSFVGAPARGERAARDAVNVAMINHWCDAIGDRNPAYTGDDPIAPPALLGSWTMDGNTAAADVWAARGEGADDQERGPRDEVLRRLDEAGYTSVVAVNYEQTYHRALRPGDLLTETLAVEDMSDRKDTALGTGFFVTVRHDYRDAEGDIVGVARMRLLKFKPPADTAAPTSAPAKDHAQEKRARRPQPPINRDNAFFWEGVEAGELRIQRCSACSTLRHPPRPMCGSCRSTEWDTIVASGRGEVYSYAVHHHPPLPGIELPLTVILVELEEGVRFVSTLTGAGPDEVHIGMPVELVVSDVGDDVSLPLFRPRERVQA